jgi:hypothetical protein
MSDSSRGTSPPIELNDMPCGAGLFFRRPDRALVYRVMPCRTKACPTCGPRLRATWAEQWSHAMASDQVYRLVVDDGEVAKLRRRKALAGKELAQIPGPDGTRVVYTTAPIGLLCEDVPLALTSDFAAMPNDTRRRSLSAGWAQVVADAQEETAASREPWECLGRSPRSIEQVVMIATDLGLLVGRSADTVVMKAPEPAQESRLFALLRLERGWRRKQVAA